MMTPTLIKPPCAVRYIRSHPLFYSSIAKLRLGYSRYIAGARERRLYSENRRLFAMNTREERHCEELRYEGFTVLHDFFNVDYIDSLQKKADSLLRSLTIDLYDAYSVHNGKRPSLDGLSYAELERTEKMICLKDPLVNVRECIDIAFNVNMLKIVTNFLGYVAPWFKVMLLRDFPSDRPKEASNFHRDNDEADSVQVFTYLVDIDETRGPLIYVPSSNRYDVRSCRPRLSRDLGIPDHDGRISDREIDKYYPEKTWKAVRARRGSIAIIHGNGFHKGPSWARYGNPTNQPRTAVRLDFHGHKLGVNMRWKANKLRRDDYARLNPLQKLFADESAVLDT
jgi:hypothetical protein